MTLLETIRRHGGASGIMARIDDLSAKPVPYTFNKGKIPREALDQGVFWRDRSGKLYEIAEMAPIHAYRASIKLWGAFNEDLELALESTPLFQALVKRARVRG